MGELKSGLAELRELARDIHPPLLTEQGLEPALRPLVTNAPVPVTLAADTGTRLPAPVEIADDGIGGADASRLHVAIPCDGNRPGTLTPIG